ncbi:deubiquitinating enzyme [Ascosphaera pollenicola]|nr:deubiquitinating enzyme [Ascosphaera pollenicola]
MSRLHPQPHRGLTLTEELERLEQQITLTLQEIDSNFSRAHRIVTTSILPIVDQHAEQSRRVWEGAKFWKQFFESSANVSLSGYEEAPAGDGDEPHNQGPDNMNQAAYEDESTLDARRGVAGGRGEDDSYFNASQNSMKMEHDEPDLSTLSMSPSRSTTPRPTAFPRMQNEEKPTTPIDYNSPYEQMRRELNETPSKTAPDTGPITPERPHATDISATPMSSPWIPQPESVAASGKRPADKRKEDPLFHRVLDKTYRIQSTPLGASRNYAPSHFGASRGGFNAGFSAAKPMAQPSTAASSKARPAFLDSSPPSSPELEAPKLNAELFNSPLKSTTTTYTPRKSPAKFSPVKLNRSPAKPGVSVLTPVKPAARQAMWDSDGEGEDDTTDATHLFGGSPPKTMQFHVPQTRLLQTPAKEASRRIVSDLLTTAGGSEITDENIATPDIVHGVDYIDDDSF